MRKTIIACAVAALFVGSAAVPAFADDVIIRGDSYDNGYHSEHHRDRPGVVVSDRGIAIGTVRDHDRDRYQNRDRCVTKSVTRTNSDGDQITKTMRRCD